jgi:hypothetical protein
MERGVVVLSTHIEHWQQIASNMHDSVQISFGFAFFCILVDGGVWARKLSVPTCAITGWFAGAFLVPTRRIGY